MKNCRVTSVASRIREPLRSGNGRSEVTAPELKPSMAGGLDADTLGDLDLDGKDEFAVMTPVFQEVRVLEGKELKILWARTFDSLLDEVLPAPEEASVPAEPEPEPDSAD